MVIKKIDPVSCMKVTSLVFLIGGFSFVFLTVAITFGTPAIFGVATPVTRQLIGWLSIVVGLFFYGVVGLVTGYLLALAYNLTLPITGGLKLELE